MTIDERQKAQRHIAALEEFIKSPAYNGYKVAKEFEVKELERQYLDQPINDNDDVIKLAVLKGKLELAREAVTTFEDARDTLKAKIENALNEEKELATTKTV